MVIIVITIIIPITIISTIVIITIRNLETLFKGGNPQFQSAASKHQKSSVQRQQYRVDLRDLQPTLPLRLLWRRARVSPACDAGRPIRAPAWSQPPQSLQPSRHWIGISPPAVGTAVQIVKNGASTSSQVWKYVEIETKFAVVAGKKLGFNPGHFHQPTSPLCIAVTCYG